MPIEPVMHWIGDHYPVGWFPIFGETIIEEKDLISFDREGIWYQVPKQIVGLRARSFSPVIRKQQN